MIHDDMKKFVCDLCAVHGFNDVSVVINNNNRNYGAEIPNCDGIKLYVFYYPCVKQINFISIPVPDWIRKRAFTNSNNSFRKLYSFDEFLELLPEEYKEIFLWNIHLLG